MDTMQPNPPIDPAVDVMGVPRKTAFKEKLGQLGRKVKQVDLREQIIANPLPAVGIAAACGAILAMVQPAPRPHRVTSALLTLAGAIGFRFVRAAAMTYMSTYAKEWLVGSSKVATGTNPNTGTDQGY